MTLIKSISGFRGTIGGAVGNNLTPVDLVQLSYAYALWIKEQSKKEQPVIVIGRDGRVSGDMVSRLVTGTLMACGVQVKDAGLSTTPTIEMLVPHMLADGGIILTASHNPMEWNALKLLNKRGEFISASDGKALLSKLDAESYAFNAVESIGSIAPVVGGGIDYHVNRIVEEKYVDTAAISKANFTVVFDGINSTGSLAIPKLLKALGVQNVHGINTEINGTFSHNPEPLKQHLTELCDAVKAHKADLGIVVDPDVDRLAFIDENGEMFGEEYTLVAVADYLFQKERGAVVSNLSSSRALADLARKHGNEYYASAVGEVNVVEKMKEVSAILGGEGNGGVIYPPLHYGRDALIGIAFVLSHLATSNKSLSALKQSYSTYFMVKDKIQLSPELDVDALLAQTAETFKDEKVNTTDGVKVDFEKGWVHLRKSNTEPIVRVYAEGATEADTNTLINRVKSAVLTTS